MIEVIRDRLRVPSPVLVATVIKTVGSTPQVAGVKALIEPDGRITGTLGGGMLEAEAQRRAGETCACGELSTFSVSMDAAYSRDAGPICGGTMWIMLDPRRGLLLPAYEAAADALRAHASGVLVTPIEQHVAPKWIGSDAADAEAGDGAEVREVLHRETPHFREETPAVFIEPIVPAPRLLVVGAGHVGQAVAQQAQLVGFDVTVVDDRPDYTQPDRFPAQIATHHGVVADMVRGFGIDASTFVVLVTKGHRADAEALEACIDAPAAYLGMIGSRRKVLELKADFVARGLATEESWARVFAPIGLDIGAVSVPEIAMSIVAQLVAVRRKRSGKAIEALALP